MNLRVLLLFLASLPAICAARSIDVCPALHPASGMKWQFRSGIDSVSCVAVRTVDKQRLFAVYLGMYPDFHPEKSTRMATGVVGGRAVTWYKGVTTHDQEYLLGAVLAIPDDQPEQPLKVYVRVLHQRRSDLAQALGAIATMQVNPRWYDKP